MKPSYEEQGQQDMRPVIFSSAPARSRRRVTAAEGAFVSLKLFESPAWHAQCGKYLKGRVSCRDSHLAELNVKASAMIWTPC
jgi:hypothetical protein